MGSTIARNAGKRATCLWLTCVDTEIQSVEISLGDDHRLIAGAVAAATFFVAAADSDESTVCHFRRAGVDRVQHETYDGVSVTRLTKYLSRPA